MTRRAKRIKAKAREVKARTYSPRRAPLDRIFVPIPAGVPRVNSDTALSLSAVWRSVNLIAGNLAALPWHAFEWEDETTKRRLFGSPIERVLNYKPNSEMTAQQLRETLISHALLWGNGYAEIERDNAGRVVALWPLPADRVEPQRTDTGELFYRVTLETGGQVPLAPSRVFHLRGLGFDGVRGYSVVAYAARSLSLALTVDEFGSSWFGNGGHVGGVLQHPRKLSKDAKDRLRADFETAHRGASRAGRLIVLEEGLTYEKTAIPPTDSQFLESRSFQVTEVARWFGVPPHKLGDLTRATFANVESENISFVTDCLLPWARRLELEADTKLLRPDAQFTRLQLRALLRGDAASRATFYRELFQLGVFSVNEIRELEDMNPIADGDKRLVQVNLTTLEQAGTQPQATGRPAPGDPGSSSSSPPGGDPSSDAAAARVRAGVLLSRREGEI